MTRFCAGVCLGLRVCARARELTLSFAQFKLTKTLFLIRVTRFERIHVTSPREFESWKSAIYFAVHEYL